MRYVIALLIFAWSSLATSQPMYSKSTEFSALRVSYASIQSVLDKAGSLVSTANGEAKPEREELVLQAKDLRIHLPGRQLLASPAKLPDQIDRLNYSFFATSTSPITQLEFEFSG